MGYENIDKGIDAGLSFNADTSQYSGEIYKDIKDVSILGKDASIYAGCTITEGEGFKPTIGIKFDTENIWNMKSGGLLDRKRS